MLFTFGWRRRRRRRREILLILRVAQPNAFFLYVCRNSFRWNICAMMVREEILRITWWLWFPCDQRMKLISKSIRWELRLRMVRLLPQVSKLHCVTRNDKLNEILCKQLVILNYSCLFPQHRILSHNQFWSKTDQVEYARLILMQCCPPLFNFHHRFEIFRISFLLSLSLIFIIVSLIWWILDPSEILSSGPGVHFVVWNKSISFLFHRLSLSSHIYCRTSDAKWRIKNHQCKCRFRI